MDKNGNGVCIFAYNNEQLDYVKFASVVSKFVKRNMKNNAVALITNEGTEKWMRQSLSQQTMESKQLKKIS